MSIWNRIPREIRLYLIPVLFAFKDGFQGMSLGKWILGIQVVDRETREPAGFLASFKRNLPVVIPKIGPLCALAIGFMLGRGSRWGDGWANTKVIWRKHAHRMPFDTRGVCCQECGYDLTGNVSGVCPECGKAVPPPPVRTLAEATVRCPWCSQDRRVWQFVLIHGTLVCVRCVRGLVQRREAAFVLDVVWLLLIWFLASSASSLFGDSFWMAPSYPAGLALMFAFSLKDGIRGMSPGKALLQLRVVRASDGRPAGPIASLIRNSTWLWPFSFMVIVRAIHPDRSFLEGSVIGLWFAVAIALAVGVQRLMKGQRVGDWLASTYVVRMRDLDCVVNANSPQEASAHT